MTHDVIVVLQTFTMLAYSFLSSSSLAALFSSWCTSLHGTFIHHVHSGLRNYRFGLCRSVCCCCCCYYCYSCESCILISYLHTKEHIHKLSKVHLHLHTHTFSEENTEE